MTLSLSLLALTGLTDRFLLANFSGAAAAGDYGASFDLVRQALIIPAVSVASAFVPMTVRIFTARGAEAARSHLEQCLEILLAVCLPACVGFALVSPQIADFALGPDFRRTAHAAMPYLALGVAFQILNQQYMHTSFLLSNRNAFYLVNTGSVLLFNIVVSFLLIRRFGVMGAVWGRVGAEIFGFATALVLSRASFAMPFPAHRLARVAAAVAAMTVVLRCIAANAADQGPSLLFVLISRRSCRVRGERLDARHSWRARELEGKSAGALASWRRCVITGRADRRQPPDRPRVSPLEISRPTETAPWTAL